MKSAWLLLFFFTGCRQPEMAETVNGPLSIEKLGTTLSHEHVLVDFIGADSIAPGRYVPDSVFHKALPYLLEIKKLGVSTLMECTPAYLGRDVKLLERLSRESGLQILTNTGYYGAAGEKFLPRHVFSETPEQIAERWISEFEKGIDGTTIKPGFMKLGADKGPLTGAQRKIMEAGAIAHLKTGLTIAVHTGDGNAAREEFEIFDSMGVAPEAFVWVHAQSEEDLNIHKELASQGVWIEFDSVNPESLDRYILILTFMKENKLLHRVLLSHDAGWYHVGEPGGGNYNGYTTLLKTLVPMLKRNGFTQDELDQIMIENPAEAFAIGIRRKP